MLATRKKPVEGYLLKQSVPKPPGSSSSKKASKQQTGLFRKLFFALDRDAGLLLYYASQQEHLNASSSSTSASASSSTSGGGPEGSIPLLDVEFVEELAKERPAPELLVRTESSRRDKKDKSSSWQGDVSGSAADEPRSAWQWPFVIHTTNQGTHLILAPTAEVRDNWVVNLEEGIAEAKLRARKSKSKSQRLSDLSGRERSESEVQADFLDILVFDSYVHELRKKNAPEEAEATSPRNASYHAAPPLSPLNLKPPPKVPSPSSRSPRYGDAAGNAVQPHQSPRSIQLQTQPETPMPTQATRLEQHERLTQSQSTEVTTSSDADGQRKGSRSQTVWRKEERKGSVAKSADGSETPPKRRIGVRERVIVAGDADNAASAADWGSRTTLPIRKTASEETVTTTAATKSCGDQATRKKNDDAIANATSAISAEPKNENETNKATTTETTTTATREQVPKRLSAGKRMYHTVRGPRPRANEAQAEGAASGGSGGFGLSLHRRNLSMDFQTIVRASASEAAVAANATAHAKSQEEAETDQRIAEKSEEKSEQQPEAACSDEPVQLRDGVARRLVLARTQLREAEDDSSESSESETTAGAAHDTEFFEQMQFMQRRLSVIYRRMNDMEGDIFSQQHQASQPESDSAAATSPNKPRKTRKKLSSKTATAALLRKEDQQAVRADQEMLQAVVRREVVCRRLHKLVDNPMDHDVQFLVSRDTSTRRGPYMIPDTTREAFIEVLSYLYSGSVSLTLDTLQDVYKAAATLRIKEMKAACRQLAARHAVTLPPRPTSSPYHVAKRQSVLDLFKNVDFEEARVAALATSPRPLAQRPEGARATPASASPSPSSPTPTVPNGSDKSDDGGTGDDASPKTGKSRSKRMSQGLARVKSVLSLVSPRNSQGVSPPAAAADEVLGPLKAENATQ